MPDAGRVGYGQNTLCLGFVACMGSLFVKMVYDSGLQNFELVGSDRRWANTYHGQLFEYLCLRQIADTLIFLALCKMRLKAVEFSV